MKNRVYIHTPRLHGTVRSLNYILTRIAKTDLGNNSQIYICHSPGSREELEKNLEKHNLSLTYRELYTGPEAFEYPTLKQIWDDSQKEDFNCLYLHAKGSSKTDEQELLNAEAWMSFMLYGVVDNYKKCLKHLEKGAELVGSQYYWHFKGNFWWGNSSHLKQMPNPIELGPDRYNAEYWCCLGLWWNGLKKPLVKNLFYVVDDISDDTQYLELSKQIPLKKIDFEYKRSFVDRRIDSSQKYTLAEFLQSNYKCAFSDVSVLAQDENFFHELKDFLNYDSTVSILMSVGAKPMKLAAKKFNEKY